MKTDKKWQTTEPKDSLATADSVSEKNTAAELIIEKKATPKQSRSSKPEVSKPTAPKPVAVSEKAGSKLLVVSKKPDSRRNDLQRRVRSDAVPSEEKAVKLIPSQVVIPRSTKSKWIVS